MADIFISYKREDRPFAERLSIALEQLGFEVWWDFDLLSGEPYRKVIRTVIDQCAAAIVLWSVRAVESDFVIDEATYAKSKGKLCPARIDDVELPFGFGALHTDSLQDWSGELSHPGFQAMVRALEARIGRKGKLGALRAPDAQASASELEAFKAAQIGGSEIALRSFIKSYPRGAFAAFVRSQMETIASNAPRVTANASTATSAFAGGGASTGFGGAASVAPMETPRRGPPWAIIAGAAAVVVAVSATFFFVQSQQQAERARIEQQAVQREHGARLAAEQRAAELATQAETERAARLRAENDALEARNQLNGYSASTSAAWRGMVGDWHRVSGTNCDSGYRIASSGAGLTRAFTSGSGWGSASSPSTIVNNSTVAFGSTQLRLSSDRIYVSNSAWTSGCEFARGAPAAPAAAAPAATSSVTWRSMVGEWRRVSGTMCTLGYRIEASGSSLVRTYYQAGSGWGAREIFTPGVGSAANTATNSGTQLRLSGNRLYVSNSSWSSGCEFTRGSPVTSVASTASTMAPSTSQFDLALLNAQVRAAVERARSNENIARSTAAQARSAATSGDDAARRARSAETGYHLNASGSRNYAGAWSNSRANGYGTLTFQTAGHEGDQFSGRFADGFYTLGAYRFRAASLANRYEGQFNDSGYQGYGVYTWRSGASFAGLFSSGAQNGHGVYHFNDGSRYEGERANNQPHGYGVRWNASGRVSQQGVWASGSLSTPLSR